MLTIFDLANLCQGGSGMSHLGAEFLVWLEELYMEKEERNMLSQR